MELTVQKRDITGKAVRRLRAAGLLPGELYGRGRENVHVAIPARDFGKVFKAAGESALIELVLESEKYPVMIHDVARDPVTDEIITVDFYQVRMDEKITVDVPLHFIGTSPAVKDKGGVLIKAMHELEVEVFPNNIPANFEVHISRLTEIDQSIYVRDLAIPEGVEVLAELNAPVATVTGKEKEEEIPVAEVDLSQVKVEGEEKVQERQAKKEEAAQAKQAPAQTKQPEENKKY